MPVVQWKKPGCLGFVKGIILPSYVGTMKKHEKDPYSTTRIQWKEMPVAPPQNPLKNGKNRGPKHPGLPLGPRILRVNQIIWSLTLWLVELFKLRLPPDFRTACEEAGMEELKKKSPPKIRYYDSLRFCVIFVRFFGKQKCNKSQNVCIDKVLDEHRLVEDQQFTKKDDGLKVRPQKSYTVVQQLEI